MINHISAVVTQNKNWHMVCSIASNNATHFDSIQLRTENVIYYSSTRACYSCWPGDHGI